MKQHRILIVSLATLVLGAASGCSSRDSSASVVPVASQTTDAKFNGVQINEDGSRRLNIGLRIEKDDAPSSPVGDPFAVMMSVLPDPAGPPSDAVSNPKCVWKIQSVRYRANKDVPWRDVTPQDLKSDRSPIELTNLYGERAYGNTFIPHYKQPGEWKSIVRADVTLTTADASWHGTVSHQIDDVLTSADLKQRTARRLVFREQRENGYRQAKKQAQIDEELRARKPGKDYIAGVQWSIDSGNTWRDTPTDRTVALSVQQFTTLGLRVVKTKPDPEGADPGWMPTWEYDGVKYFGDQVYLGTQEISNGAATMDCGRKIKIKIRVEPKPDRAMASTPKPKPTPKPTPTAKPKRSSVDSAARGFIRKGIERRQQLPR